MSRSQRRTDPSKQLSRLEKRHRKLKERVAAYESQLSLTAQEEAALQRMKKEKLATKDAIHRMTS